MKRAVISVLAAVLTITIFSGAVCAQGVSVQLAVPLGSHGHLSVNCIDLPNPCQPRLVYPPLNYYFRPAPIMNYGRPVQRPGFYKPYPSGYWHKGPVFQQPIWACSRCGLPTGRCRCVHHM